MKTSEQLLIRKITGKDEKALSYVISLYQQKLFYFVNKQLKNREESEEIVQDIFFEFIESLRNFRGDAKLQTYLFSIARHKVIDAIRRRKIKRVLFSALPDYIVEGLKTVVLDDEVDRNELTRKINAVIGTLPHDYQVVLRLKYMEQKKVREIARALRLSFKATESLVFRARRAFIAQYNNTS